MIQFDFAHSVQMESWRRRILLRTQSKSRGSGVTEDFCISQISDEFPEIFVFAFLTIANGLRRIMIEKK